MTVVCMINATAINKVGIQSSDTNDFNKSSMENIEKKCPTCGATVKQHKQGFNKSGTQRCKCQICGRKYTLNPKSNAYPEEIRQQVIKTLMMGVSGRGVGKIFNMSKSNAYRWLKKKKATNG